MNAGCAGKAVRSLENACHTRAPYAVVTSEIKLKQNNFTETKHCFAFVLFQSCFSFISVITIALEVCSRESAIQKHLYLTFTFAQLCLLIHKI